MNKMEEGFSDPDKMQEFYNSLSAMSVACRDLIALSSLSLANYTLLRRDLALSAGKYKNETLFEKSHQSSLSANKLFGPEAQTALDEYRKDPATVVKTLVQSVQSFRDNRQPRHQSRQKNFSARNSFTSFKRYHKNFGWQRNGGQRGQQSTRGGCQS
jgi:hypothetical protein